MKVLSLNCQRGYHPHLPLREFLQQIFAQREYDFILLQEFAKEVPSFVSYLGSYKLLKVYNKEVSEDAQVCIAYRNEYELLASDLVSFATKRPDPVVGITHSTFGLVCGRFTAGDRTVVVGSLHLHAGMSRGVRKAQMQTIKKHMLELQKPGDTVVFGGDCNLGPREHNGIASLLGPEFVWVSDKMPPTLDGWYSENVRRLPNRIGALLRFFGIPVRLWTDQIFVDEKTAATHTVECRVLPDRVSDHSPIEVVLSNKKNAQDVSFG